MCERTLEHTNMHEVYPEVLVSLQEVSSEPIPFTLVPNPTRRYLKKLELDYVHCPDCESKDIIYHGYSNQGTQKYRCKGCGYQFVLNFDAIFPRSKRHLIFDNEFMANLKPTGFQKGCGRRQYWEGVRFQLLNQMESQAVKVRFKKLIRNLPIRSERDYRLILEFIMNEAYVYCIDT